MTEIQEKRLYALVLVLIVVVALFGSLALYASYRGPGVISPPPGPEPKTISVSGIGTVSMSPDVGWFVASVVTQAATAAQAEQQDNDAMAKVISALTSAGIAEKDIQTLDYSLNPIYQEAKEPGKMPILVGYSVRHTIRVTVNDINTVGKMLDLAISNGANDVGGVYFGLSDAKAQQAQSQTLDLAVKDANNKARTIANAMGATLVGPISVNIGYYYEPVRADYKQAEASQVPIQPGQLQYTVNVQIVYTFN
jgi:hypothetical protein